MVLLFVGGEGLIRGAVVISRRLGLSALLIGTVIVGFGTSTPELIVSVQAALNDQSGIALGNVVGSNIANVMLILAIAALILPLPCRDPAMKRDAVMVVAASIFMMMAAQIGVISAVTGGGMVCVLLGYIFYCYQAERKTQHEKAVEHEIDDIPKMRLPVAIVAALGGIAVLMVGAQFLVDGATTIARSIGVSEAIIGLTLVAVGTSLPELAASVIGAYRKQTDMVVGNILGSNMFNILFILGVAGLIKPIPVDGRIAELDIPIMLAVAIGTVVVIMLRGQLGRITGAGALVLYVAYVFWMFSSGQA